VTDVGAALTADVWWAEPSWIEPWHLDVLSAEERDRAASYRYGPDRARFVVAAALLRLVVGMRVRATPSQVPVGRRCARCGGPHGRPVIVGTDLGVSVSHARDRVVVAVTRGVAVGVDVEEFREIDVDALSSMVLSADEGTSSPTRAGFFSTWVRKEAVLKSLGTGVDVPMTALSLAAVGAGTHVASVAGRPGADRVVVDLDAGPGHAAALALEPDPWRERSAGVHVLVHEQEAAALVRREPIGADGDLGAGWVDARAGRGPRRGHRAPGLDAGPGTGYG
jgi:4'-phosphopantetheinyl transferase